MTTTDLVQFATFARARGPIVDSPGVAPSYHQLVTPVRSAIVGARRQLLSRQRHDGCWLGRQVGDASLPSQLLILLSYFGRETTELADQAANAILGDQLEDGGWPTVPGGRSDLSVSVQAYFALKLAGHKANRPHMAAARELVRELGGADRADAPTRTLLAVFGQVAYDVCGASAAKRAPMIVHPQRTIGLSRGVRELFIAHPSQWPLVDEDLSRQDSQFLEVVWQLIATHTVGGDEIPTLSRRGEEQLLRLVVIDQERDEARPCLGISPASDTAIVCKALLVSGVRSGRSSPFAQTHSANAGDADTLELAATIQLFAASGSNQGDDSALPPNIQLFGDHRVSEAAARNQITDDLEAAQERVVAIVEMLLSRQNRDGGWSAGFPLATDSDPAATATVVEALASSGNGTEHAAVGRGVEFLRSAQRADGSWDSATGIRFIHGTSRAVQGLVAAGVLPDDPAVEAGVNWLLVHQQESGGWGEGTSHTNEDDRYVAAAASAIQTAWALAALVAAGWAADDATLLGIQFLVDTQEDEGDWQDAQFTLRESTAAKLYRNDLHTAAESLTALASWAIAASSERGTIDPVGLKLCTT